MGDAGGSAHAADVLGALGWHDAFVLFVVVVLVALVSPLVFAPTSTFILAIVFETALLGSVMDCGLEVRRVRLRLTVEVRVRVRACSAA